MKKFIFILSLILVTNQLFCQYSTAIIRDHQVAFLPQGHNNFILSGYGNSGLVDNISNLSSVNPASLINYNSIEIGISHKYATDIDNAWLAGIGYKRSKKYLPQSFGIVIPASNIVSIGFSAEQKYNAIMDVGEIPVTTVDNPDGNGELLQSKFEHNIINYSALVAFKMGKLSDGSSLTFGFRYSFNSLYVNEEFIRYGIEEIVHKGNLSAGLLYNNVTAENKYFQIGLMYEKGIDFNKSTFVLFDENIATQPVISKNIKSELPPIARLETDLSTFDNLRLLASINYTFWEKISGNIKNQIEYSASYIFKTKNNITPSLGFIYSTRDFGEDMDEAYKTNKNLKYFYITGGLVYDADYFKGQLIIADSHLFSGDWMKQTIIKTSISYKL